MHLVVARASETAGCGGRPLAAATVKGERAARPLSFERGKEEGVLKAAFFVCFVVLRGSRFCLFPFEREGTRDFIRRIVFPMRTPKE